MDLQILSLEGQFYIVKTVDESGSHLLTDRHNAPQKFHCLEEIRDHFAWRSLDDVWLEQQTPYEEMCGLTDDTAPLRIKLNW
ncbi:DUF6482 family protein [Microbulbifer elongatus]|uniref:NADH-quinone reductase n=1 Tax=Microbulbifer elongatus TaxID=86173 RepID=A0ABT1P2D2_9GAMM|nr:DUF6482 family protein [Microbulbifer elongatus]MCQ3829667.1 NADH-quinone reductase [Microbulbifer elongatus]